MNIHTLSRIRTLDHSNTAAWPRNRRICKIIRSSSISPPPHGAKAPTGPGPPHCRGFTITLRHTTLDRTHPDNWKDRSWDLFLTPSNTLKHPCNPRGIRTQNPSKRTTVDPRLRPPGHWDRLCTGTSCKFCTGRVLDPYLFVVIQIHTTLT